MAEGGEQSLEISDGGEIGEEIIIFAENMFLYLNEKFGPGIEVLFSSQKKSRYYNLTIGKTASFIYEAARDNIRETLRKNYPFGSKKIGMKKFRDWLQNTLAQYHVECGVFRNLFSSAAFVFEAVLFAVERGLPQFYPCVAGLWSYIFARKFGEEFLKSGGFNVLESDESCALLYYVVLAESQNNKFDFFRKIVRDILLPDFYTSCPVEGIEMETETRGAYGFSEPEGSYPKESAESFSPRKNKNLKKKEKRNETLSCPVEGIEMEPKTRGAYPKKTAETFSPRKSKSSKKKDSTNEKLSCPVEGIEMEPGTRGAYPKKSAGTFSPEKNKSSKKERTNETLSCPVEDIEMATDTRGAYPKKSAGSFSPGKNKSSNKGERTIEKRSSFALYNPRDDFSIKETPPELLQAGFPAFVFPDEHFSRKLLNLYTERSISTKEVMRRYKEHNRQPVMPAEPQTESCVSELTESIGQLRVSSESSSKVKAEDDKTESLAVDSNEESECSEDESAENESEESSEEGNTQQRRSPRKKRGGKKKKGKGKGGKKKRKK